jgi:hypothetical protein
MVAGCEEYDREVRSAKSPTCNLECFPRPLWSNYAASNHSCDLTLVTVSLRTVICQFEQKIVAQHVRLHSRSNAGCLADLNWAVFGPQRES